MKTQFDWNLLRPEQAVSEAHMSIVREIAGTFLITGVGISDHQKRVELGKDRHLLNELVQVGLIRNIANCFYPTFAGLFSVESQLRDSYARTLAGMLTAFKTLFEKKAPQRFAFQEIEAELSALVLDINSAQLSKAVNKDAPPLRAAIFLQDFPHFVNILESNYPGSPATSLMPTDALLDYEDLEQAWQYELAQRSRPAVAQAVAHAKASGDGEISTTRRKKVFVIHGRDERLRAGVFEFLRALHLEPLEWINAIQLTEKASPYIGEVLDAAFRVAQAVVVLLSPDDEARLRPELLLSNDSPSEKELTGQARPNVLFEAGMSFASHADRTVLLQFGEVRPFSDIAGRHIVRMDNSGAKRQEFATKLKTAECDLNTDGIEWHTAGDLTPPSIEARTPASSSLHPLSNLVSLDPLGTKIVARDRSDTWRDAALQRSENAFPLWKATIAIFRNEPLKGVILRPIQGMTAQITFFDANGGEVQRVNNGTWLGNPFNSVSFSVGDTYELLIAIRAPLGGRDCTIENTRKRSGASTYEDAGSLEKLLERKRYDITVRLIGMVENRGDVNEDFRFSLDLRNESPTLRREWTK